MQVVSTNLLQAYWKLHESSGTRFDLSGNANDLSATNSPGNTAARLGNGVSLNGSNQYLSRASTASLSFADEPFWISLWFNTSNKNITLLHKGTSNGAASTFEYLISLTNGSPYCITFAVSNGTTAGAQLLYRAQP